MFKKLTLLVTSVSALLAFVAPSAQAEGPLITTSLGEAATNITGVSTNYTTHTPVGTLECTTSDLKIHLTENAKTTAKGHGTATAVGAPPAHTGACGTSSGFRKEITSITIKAIHLTKHGGETTGTTALSYTYDTRNSGGALIAECTFTGSALAVKKTGAATLNITGELVKTAGGAFCPSIGFITADYAMTDEFGAPVVIH